MMLYRLAAWSLALCTLVVVPAAAQDHPDATHPAQTIDVGDLWRLVRHRPLDTDDASSGHRFLVLAPTIGSKPTTGFTAGFSGNIAFIRRGAGTHISTLSGGFKVSQKRQTSFGAKLALFTANDRWFVLAEDRMQWTSASTYALGADAPKSSGTNVKFDVLKLYESAYRKVGRSLFVGAGINLSAHTDVRPGTTTGAAAWDGSAYVAYSQAHGFSTAHQRSSGTSVGVRYDTRDNGINAAQGSLASATYRTFFSGFAGGDSTWQELALDARTVKRITPDARHKVAFWFLGDLVTGGTAPYWDLPATAIDGRSARGYGEGRYRGERLLYWETEYRGALTRNGLLGMVLFANATTVGSAEAGQHLFQSFAPGAGFGFRVLLNKRSRTNLCTDWGWGKQGSHGFYLAIQEAF